MSFFSEAIETMDRDELDALVDERIRYTVQFAAENSPFYRNWFRTNKIDPSTIREHEDDAIYLLYLVKTSEKGSPLRRRNSSSSA